MKTTILSTVSIIALAAASPAIADNAEANAKVGVSASGSVQTERTKSQNDIPEVTEEDIERGWENTKKAVSETAEDVSNATQEAYEEISAALIENDQADADFTTVTLDSRMTASGMIGKPVYNTNGESVATVKDIILDREGQAIMVVVADGEFIGMGKQAAFDYNAITHVNADGDVIMPLTEQMIENAAEFSYDRERYSETVKVIPSNGYSVAELLDAQLVNPQKETVGDVDNISFKNGQANHIIIGFDKILGLGGKKAAMEYDSATLVRNGDDLDFQLSANQAAQFEAYKKTSSN